LGVDAFGVTVKVRIGERDLGAQTKWFGNKDALNKKVVDLSKHVTVTKKI